ncbi:MAG: phage holin family protein [Candidatus Peribacteraceae bacterium]
MFGNLTSSPVKLVLKAALNVLLVYALDSYFSEYFAVFGGPAAYVIVGSLLTLLNLFVRPLLNIITLPFKLIATLLTTVLLNALFLWLVYQLALRMDPDLIALAITGGFTGWIVVSSVLGFSNWLFRLIL